MVLERVVILVVGFGIRMGRKFKGFVRVVGREILYRIIRLF